MYCYVTLPVVTFTLRKEAELRICQGDWCEHDVGPARGVVDIEFEGDAKGERCWYFIPNSYFHWLAQAR